ncbi:MAG: HlyD family efflux transporter periplasmic adaptor subunit [Cyclobacteriaceae bacterium]
MKNTVRTIINISIGVIVLGVAIFVATRLIKSKKSVKPVAEKAVASVYVEKVKNTTVPIIVPAHGNLTAVNKVELYAEVQGVFQNSSKTFKAGQAYRKGDVLIGIDAGEYNASIVAQKSALQALITSSISDLKFDYPDSYPNWLAYLESFDLNKPLKALPKPLSKQEEFYINGKNIVTTYYNIKNMEERLQKYTIRAGFDGVLTEALVNPGTLVRTGQKLGEYIDPSVYELEVSLSKAYADLLEVGKEVNLHIAEQANTWVGKVARINSKVDPTTQSVQVFIRVSGDTLKEGMYLEASVEAREEPSAIEISRSLISDNNEIMVVEDDQLKMKEVTPVYFADKTVVIKGLPDGTVMLSKPVMGAYEGMAVKIIKD